MPVIAAKVTSRSTGRTTAVSAVTVPASPRRGTTAVEDAALLDTVPPDLRAGAARPQVALSAAGSRSGLLEQPAERLADHLDDQVDDGVALEDLVEDPREAAGGDG